MELSAPANKMYHLQTYIIPTFKHVIEVIRMLCSLGLTRFAELSSVLYVVRVTQDICTLTWCHMLTKLN